MRLLIYFLVSHPKGCCDAWRSPVSKTGVNLTLAFSTLFCVYWYESVLWFVFFFPPKPVCIRPLSLHSYGNQGADKARTRVMSPKSSLLGLHSEMQQTHCWQLHSWHQCLHPSPPALQHRSSLLDLQSDTISTSTKDSPVHFLARALGVR